MLNRDEILEKIVSSQNRAFKEWYANYEQYLITLEDTETTFCYRNLNWRADTTITSYANYLRVTLYDYFDEPIARLVDKVVETANTPTFATRGNTTIKARHALIEEGGLSIYPYHNVHAWEYIESNEELLDSYTGELIQSGDIVVIYKDGFTKADNITNDSGNWYICQYCGDLCNFSEDEATDTADGYVCPDCIDNYEPCDCCHELVNRDDTREIYRSSWSREIAGYYCQSCADSEAGYCDCCGNYYLEDTMEEVGYDGYVCESCFDDHYVCCEDCGQTIRRDDAYWIDDEPYCEECAEERQATRVISSYHAHHHNYLDTYGESNKRIGTETEIEGERKSGQELDEMATEVMEMMDNHVFCEHDGSLINGFEIITKPHTPEEFYKLPFKEMLEKLRENGYTSHNNGRCGLHIHFSNEWFGDNEEEIDDNVAKVVHFYSDNYDTMVTLSRRMPSQLHWARKFPVKDFAESKISKYGSVGHDVAVNLQNMRTIHTVEFRLGRGTLKYESYMAWVDMHIAIARNSRVVEKDDTDLNHWLKGIKEETKAYIKDRTGIEIVDEEREVA